MTKLNSTTLNINIKLETKEKLKELAIKSDRSMTYVLEKLIEKEVIK